MDRNRDRRSVMAASANRRRHRNTDEDRPAEYTEPPARFRDRGVKKDRSSRRRKRDDSSEESSGDDDDDGGSVFTAVSRHHQVRESFYEDSRPATTTWKPANEVIQFSVPRKARSASTKRTHENWVSGNGVGGHSSASPSPVRPAVPSPVSPTSSSASIRKKTVNKLNGGTKQRPPKSTAKTTSSTKPEEDLEIEIAEVLYGLKTQSQASVVPSSISDSTSPENRNPSSVHLSAIAPKRKRPRQVSEDLGSPGVAQSSISSITDSKINTEHGLEEKQSRTNEDFAGGRRLPEPEMVDSGSVVTEFKPVSEEDSRDIRDVGPTNQSIVAVDCDDVKATSPKTCISGMGSHQEERFEIDLMAPPPQSPEREDYNVEDGGGDEAVEVHRDKKKAKVVGDVVEQDKEVLPKDVDTSLQLDLGKPEREVVPVSGNEDSTKLQSQNPSAKCDREEHSVAANTVQCSSMPLPLSLAGWPNGCPPIGYVAPLQGAAPIGVNAVSPLVQPLFSRSRSKRCATHYHIAQTIHCQQQFMKMNPFWPGAAAPIFSGNACNVNVLPPGESQRSLNSVPDRNQGVLVLPSDNGREKGCQSLNTDQQRKQQIVFQQALPAGVSPNSVMPVPAFVFPMNQQPVVAAAASAQSGSAKLPAGSTNMSNPIPASGSATASPPVSFNYQNMPSNNGHPYLAILQNNPYPFPISASGAPPAFGGVAHAQPIPYFYPSQLIHPMQIQQQHQQANQNTSNSSASATLQKQQQKQQHQQQRSHLMPASLQEAGGEDTPSTAESHASRFPTFSQNFAANFALAAPSPSNGVSHGAEKKTQQPPQQGTKQPFTMSFATMNGADTSSMSGLQNLPEATRNGYHHQIMLAAASAQAAQQKRNSRLSEEGKSEGNNSSSNLDGNKTSSLGKSSTNAAHSIAFSRSAMNGMGTINNANSQLQAQLQFQQQILQQHQQQQQLQKLQQHQQQYQQQQQQQQQQQEQQQQHLLAARHKSLATSSGSTQNDYFASSSPGIAKFPGVQSSSVAALWKNSADMVSSLASAKSHSQPQVRAQHQNHTQISFLANQKSSATQSSPMVVGSPSNSFTKDGGGSPKATSSNSYGNRCGQPSTFASQQSRNASPVGNRNTQSILGNHPQAFPSSTSVMPQMQQQALLQKQQMQQAQLMFSNACLQNPSFQSNMSGSAAAAASSYYMQRWRPEQHQSAYPEGSTTSPSVVKGVVSSTGSNVKAGGLTSQGTGVAAPLFAPPGFSYHAVPAAVQVIQKEHKPAA